MVLYPFPQKKLSLAQTESAIVIAVSGMEDRTLASVRVPACLSAASQMPSQLDPVAWLIKTFLNPQQSEPVERCFPAKSQLVLILVIIAGGWCWLRPKAIVNDP